jgi:hypothetical protein
MTDLIELGEEQTLNLWHTSGLAEALQKAEGLEPIMMYLRHVPEQKLLDGFEANYDMSYFTLLRAGLWRAARRNLSTGDALSCMWIYRNLPPEMRLRLIRASLLGLGSNQNYTPSEYGPKHPGFGVNNEKWDKHCILFALKDFPNKVSYRSILSTKWLTSYETLVEKFPNNPMLYKMRRSLVQFGYKGHIDFMRIGQRPIQSLKPRTSCARKYMSLRGADRVAFMRHYDYRVRADLGLS